MMPWSNRFRYAIQADHPRGPLLVRYRLISTRWGGIYLHHLMRPDRDLHDHPWHFVSLILWRGYTEVLNPASPYRVVHRPLSLIRHKATDAHRLEMSRPAWSLFFVGPKVREWGFLTEGGKTWVRHDMYLG